jgi:hypothetical protein
MQFQHLPFSLLLLLATSIVADPSASPLDVDLGIVDISIGSCPSVWKQVADELKKTFAGCSDPARAAIRTTFHDCFPSACDGSLILANECTDRSENAQMIPVCGYLGDVAKKYKVGVADLIQGAAGSCFHPQS